MSIIINNTSSFSCSGWSGSYELQYGDAVKTDDLAASTRSSNNSKDTEKLVQWTTPSSGRSHTHNRAACRSCKVHLKRGKSMDRIHASDTPQECCRCTRCLQWSCGSCCSCSTRLHRHGTPWNPSGSKLCRLCMSPTALLTLLDSHAMTSAAPAHHPTQLPSGLSWGLHMLACVMDAPRRCVDSQCQEAPTYAFTCSCGLPTMATTRCGSRRIIIPPSLSDAEIHRLDYVEACARDRLRAAKVCPVEPHSSNEGANGSSSRSVTGLFHIFAAISVAADVESTSDLSTTGLRLWANDLPFARELSVMSVGAQCCIFESCVGVQLVSFTSYAWKDLHAGEMAEREVWTTNTPQKRTCRIGTVVVSEKEAEQLGLTQRVGSFRSFGSVVMAVERLRHTLMVDVLRMMQQGHDVVLCGHACAGSAAFIMAAFFFLEHTELAKKHLRCVTTGSPVITDAGLRSMLDAYHLEFAFHLFVCRGDVLPRLCCRPLAAFSDTATVASSPQPLAVLRVSPWSRLKQQLWKRIPSRDSSSARSSKANTPGSRPTHIASRSRRMSPTTL